MVEGVIAEWGLDRQRAASLTHPLAKTFDKIFKKEPREASGPIVDTWKKLGPLTCSEIAAKLNAFGRVKGVAPLPLKFKNTDQIRESNAD